MELKSKLGQITPVFFAILIEPLWNWNKLFTKRDVLDEYSNWTFMELKYGFPCSDPYACLILIEPLWNWNNLVAGGPQSLAAF